MIPCGQHDEKHIHCHSECKRGVSYYERDASVPQDDVNVTVIQSVAKNLIALSRHSESNVVERRISVQQAKTLRFLRVT